MNLTSILLASDAMSFFKENTPAILICAVLLLVVIGGGFGAILAYAAKKFHVEQDPRVEQITAALPGANCGSCGMPGCGGYAEAIVKGEVELNLCAPGGSKVAQMVAKIMGKEVAEADKRYSVLLCKGGNKVAGKFDYAGVSDCRAAALLLLGDKVCQYGCLGLDTCERACPFNAIVMKDGLPFVIEERCTSCGACVKACPKDLFALVSEKKTVVVGCQSHDPGKVVNKICPVGCIACKACEKACPVDAIHVIDNLAVIDYEKCKNCGLCVKACPKSTIYNMRKTRKERAERAIQAEAAGDKEAAHCCVS